MMKKIMIALLLGVTITAAAQPAFTKVQRDSIGYRLRDSLNKERAFVRPALTMLTSNDKVQASAIITLQDQVSSMAKSIATLNTKVAALEAGKMAIDFNYFDSTGGLLKTKPVDLSAVTNAVKNLQDQVNKLPVIDAVKLQAWLNWLADLKLSYTQLSK